MNQTLNVIVKDTEGKTFINKPIKTLFSGFFEIWLPRGKEYELYIEYKGKKARGNISTFNNSKTCITTFKLK